VWYKFSRSFNLIFLLLTGYLFSQEVEPSWVLFQKGKIAYSEGRWVDSIQLLRQAGNLRSVFPEADWYLGKVYFETGEMSSAMRHFQTALDEADFLRIPEEKFLIFYDIDKIYQISSTGENLSRRVSLLRDQILGSLTEERQTEAQSLRTQGEIIRERYLSAFLENYIGRPEEKRVGLDRVLFLFRKQPDYSLQALTLLSELWLKGNDQSGSAVRDSATYALHGLVMIFSRAIEELSRLDSQYQFSVFSPSLYKGQENTPGIIYPQKSFMAIFQPRLAGMPMNERLRVYEPLWEYLQKTQASKLLWTLARSLRFWAERVQNVIVGNADNYEKLLGPVLGYEADLGQPWRNIVLLTDGAPAGLEEAKLILEQLFQREQDTLRILVDIFPDSPEGSRARERMEEFQQIPQGLVRPSLGR